MLLEIRTGQMRLFMRTRQMKLFWLKVILPVKQNFVAGKHGQMKIINKRKK